MKNNIVPRLLRRKWVLREPKKRDTVPTKALVVAPRTNRKMPKNFKEKAEIALLIFGIIKVILEVVEKLTF